MQFSAYLAAEHEDWFHVLHIYKDAVIRKKFHVIKLELNCQFFLSFLFRILNSSSALHSYDALLWLLRYGVWSKLYYISMLSTKYGDIFHMFLYLNYVFSLCYYFLHFNYSVWLLIVHLLDLFFPYNFEGHYKNCLMCFLFAIWRSLHIVHLSLQVRYSSLWQILSYHSYFLSLCKVIFMRHSICIFAFRKWHLSSKMIILRTLKLEWLILWCSCCI